MRITILEERLGNPIILGNGEFDGYEILGYEWNDYEVDSQYVLDLFREYKGDDTIEMDDLDNYDLDLFLEEYGEYLSGLGKRVSE